MPPRGDALEYQAPFWRKDVAAAALEIGDKCAARDRSGMSTTSLTKVNILYLVI